MCNYVSNSEEETLAIARRVAKNIEKGQVIVLTGDLGAGKTLFVSGILDYFGEREEVSSPTFTIVNEYELKADLKLFHFDVYRLESSDEFLAMGGEEFFDQGVCLIEWGEKIADLLPKDILTINIEKNLDVVSQRIFTFSSPSSKFDQLIKEAMQE